jgi:hypothetical protein
MQQVEIHKYLVQFFHSTGCNIKEQGEGYLIVQLTIEMDKQLMNRPFYWHYLEKTGGEPSPMTLTLITEQNEQTKEMNGEFIHFGSPRLHQIFAVAKEMASYIRLYEQVNEAGNVPLHPWIGVNAKISYLCDRRKDIITSLGVNLINGRIIDQFHHHLANQKLTRKIPDYCFTLAPLIKPVSGMARLKKIMEDMIRKDDLSWIDSALKRWKEDETLLSHFYEGEEELPESYESEKLAIKEQYEPRIKVEIINGGMFYLTPQAI